MAKKTKLSILTINLGMGGAQRFISIMLPELMKDFEVTLVLFVDYIHFEIPKNVKVVILTPKLKRSNYAHKIKNAINLYFAYKKFIIEEQIDISLSLLPVPNIVNSFLAMGNKKKPKTIISERCFASEMYKHNRFQMLLAKVSFPILYHRNSALFSNSVYINEDLKQNFRVKMPMHVIYNPIDINANLQISIKNIESIKTLKIINTGRTYDAKNQKLILEAMSLSKKGDYKLTILGNGELEEMLKLEAGNLDLTQFVDFKGKVSHVKGYLIENDCFILSSNNEGFPNAMLEAMSIGLPCISTNCLSGPLEMLNDNEPITIEKNSFFKAKYGILINVNDKIGLNKALEYLKNNPKELQRYGQLAYERAKTYNIPKIYEQVKFLLKS